MHFSIIVPVYNVAEYLKECVDSVLAQTFTDFEIILVDDGSTDESPVICDKYAETDSRVKVIHKKNGGASTARNAGLNAVSGEYVMFLDGDDYWDNPNALEKISQRFSKNAVDVLVFNACKFENGKKSAPWIDNPDMPSDVSKENSLKYLIDKNMWLSSAWDKAIKRELFLKNDISFLVGTASEDIEWALRLALFADSYDFINETVLCYRQRESSVSHGMNEKKLIMLCDILEKCISFIENENTEKSEMLKTYIAYPFGTLLYNLSFLKGRNNREQFVNRIEKNLYVLNWSQNKKVKLLRVLCRVFGVENAVSLLGFISAIRG